MDIARCILKIIPDYKCLVWNDDYNQIIKHELETRDYPTLAELEAVWPVVQAEIAAELADHENEKAIREKVFKIAFNHENRLRALEEKSQITAAQFKAAVSAL